MRTNTRASLIRAQAELAVLRSRSPSRVANSSRNAGAERGRRARWRPPRDVLWSLLEPCLDAGARVAILGAGNADDLPLERITARAGSVTLIDLDRDAARRGRRRLRLGSRRRVEVVEHEVTDGAADSIVVAAAVGGTPDRTRAPETPLPGSPYDLVIGDLLYSQLLYPALFDLGVSADRCEDFLRRYAPDLTLSLVARLQRSAPVVVHLHDPLAWWAGHEQPVRLEEVLALAEAGDPSAALSAVALGVGPCESDPRIALRELGVEPVETAFWHWPFAPDVDYLVCATVTRGSCPPI